MLNLHALLGSIQAVRSSKGSSRRFHRATLDLQRTIGNRKVVQLLKERELLAEPRATEDIPETVAGFRFNQRIGSRPPGIQRRRVPDVGVLNDILTDMAATETDEGYDFEIVDAPNIAAHQAGLVRLIQRALNDLEPDRQMEVLLQAVRPLSFDEFLALPEREQLTRLSGAITSLVPELRLGDPREYNIGARTGTDDAENIRTLVTNTNIVFDDIASGSHDTSVGEIFGASNIRAAKRKYARARSWMNILHRRNKIVTDRSGYSGEVNLGGLTGFHEQISVESGAVDNPDNDEQKILMLHEAMHAGNADVDDHGYIDQPSFKELAEDVKLTNAAHFEVVPRRILTVSFAFEGETFVPAGTTGPTGTVAPALTDRQQAIRGASETFREAWTTGLNLYEFFVLVHNTPRKWTRMNLIRYGATAGNRFSHCLPFWSKVQKMTVHEKTTIDPTSDNPSIHPVSTIDIGLAEGVIRSLAAGMNSVPDDETAAEEYERLHATPAEIAAATTIEAERDLLIKLVIRAELGEVTGAEERDFRMVHTMARHNTYRSMLTRRSPADFAD